MWMVSFFLTETLKQLKHLAVRYSLISSSIRPFSASRSSRATPQTYLTRLKPLPPIFLARSRPAAAYSIAFPLSHRLK